MVKVEDMINLSQKPVSKDLQTSKENKIIFLHKERM